MATPEQMTKWHEAFAIVAGRGAWEKERAATENWVTEAGMSLPEFQKTIGRGWHRPVRRRAQPLKESTMTFPITIQASRSVVQQWKEDEYASFEDHNGAHDHVYWILDRYATKIEVLDEAELRTVITSGEYQGTAGGWDDRHAYHAAVSRLTHALKEVAR